MTSIVIASRAFLAAEGFKTLLASDNNFSFAGKINSKDDLWNKLCIFMPDILVINNNQEDLIKADDINKIKDVSPGTKILIISDQYKKENVWEYLKNGTLGYLCTECDGSEIKDALAAVAKGEKFICGKILDTIINKKLDENVSENDLTSREIEIIKLIAEKYSNQEIADMLFISIHTVYTHRKNIMKKLKLKSPVELILYALDKGLAPEYQD